MMRADSAGTRLGVAAILAILAIPATGPAAAQFTWNGASGTDELWSTAGNWLGGVPPAPGSLGGQNLIFGSTGGLQQSPDAGGDSYSDIANILYSDGGANSADASLTLIGSGTLAFQDFGTITNNSTFNQTVNIDLIGTGTSFSLLALNADLSIGGDIDLSDTGGVQLTVGGSRSTTISGIISGTGASLLKQNTGTLTLTGANTYDGGTTLAAGTIVLGHNMALGTGDLTVTGDSVIQSNDPSRTVRNGITIDPAATLSFQGASNLSLTGMITGNGALEVNTGADSVSLTLTGANDYTGGTTLKKGTIVLGNDLALGTGDLTVDGTGTIRSTANDRVIANDIGFADAASTLTFGGIADMELSGVISGDGSLSINASSESTRLKLSGANTTYTGNTTFSRGTLILGNNSALGTGALDVVGNAFIESDDDTRVMSNSTSIADMTTLTFQGANDLVLAGVITGDGGLVINGDADDVTLRLIAANDYAGGTTLARGTVLVGNNTALGTGDLHVTGDSFLQSALDAISIANNTSIDQDVSLTFSGTSNLEITGVISGDGSLIVNTTDDGDMLTLDANNTYAGGTTLMKGTIVIARDNSLGQGALDVVGDGTIQSTANGNDIENDISIADMTSLTFSGASNLGIDGTITGEGALIVNGDADDVRLRLNADNSGFTGGVTLERGTIVLGNNRALGAGPSATDPMNEGSVLTLAGDGTLEGRTGTRQVSNIIDVDAFVLTLAGDENLTMNGLIRGDGGLNINTEDGILVRLNKVNEYLGGTTLTGGTLIFGVTGAIGTGDLTLAGDGQIQTSEDDVEIANLVNTNGFDLTFSGFRDLLLSNSILGTGGLVMNGQVTAMLTLSGTSTYSGDTTVNGGTLMLAAGSSITSPVTVNDGGTLAGSGTINGDLINRLGGMVSPGESVGTLTVTGSYLQEMGSTLVVELDSAALMSDLLDVSGSATLAMDSTIEATITGDTYIPSGTQFKIIEADGGIIDQGAIAMIDSASVTVSVMPTVDPNEYFLEFFRAANAYSAAADAGNNTSIANSLDSLIPIANANNMSSAADLLVRLDALDAADYNTAVSQLSPVPYDAYAATSVENVRNFTSQQVAYLAGKRGGYETWGFTPQIQGPPPGSMAMANDDPLLLSVMVAQAEDEIIDHRLAQQRQADKSRWGRWIKLDGVFVDQDTTALRPGFNSASFGGQVGLDYSFSDDLIAGMSLAYAYTGADMALGLGSLNDNTVRGGPYVSYSKGNWFVDASASFAWHFYNGDRKIPGLGLTADSNYNGWDVTAYMGTGYYFEVAKDLRFTPMASLLYGHYSFDAFTETGAGGANLAVAGRDVDSLRSRLGAALSYRIDWKWKPIPYVYAGWEHEYLNNSTVGAAFAAGGSPFVITTGGPDQDSAFFGLGVNLLINPAMSAFLRFEEQISSNGNVSAIAGGLSVTF